MHGKTTINRGDVWAISLEPVRGSEMGKRRPCLVVSNDVANKYSRVITVVAITTTAPNKAFPFIVGIPDSARMPEQSFIDCAHIRTVDRQRLGKYYTSLDRATMKKVDEALLDQLGIEAKEDESMAG